MNVFFKLPSFLFNSYSLFVDTASSVDGAVRTSKVALVFLKYLKSNSEIVDHLKNFNKLAGQFIIFPLIKAVILNSRATIAGRINLILSLFLKAIDTFEFLEEINLLKLSQITASIGSIPVLKYILHVPITLVKLTSKISNVVHNTLVFYDSYGKLNDPGADNVNLKNKMISASIGCTEDLMAITIIMVKILFPLTQVITDVLEYLEDGKTVVTLGRALFDKAAGL